MMDEDHMKKIFVAIWMSMITGGMFVVLLLLMIALGKAVM